MKIVLTPNGRTNIDLSDTELGIILKAAHPTKYTTRQVLQALVETWSANFEQDTYDVIDALDEDAQE